MKNKIIILIAMTVSLFAEGCTKRNVVIKPVDRPVSEFQIKGDGGEVLKRIAEKFQSCDEDTTRSSTANDTLNSLHTISWTFGPMNFIVDNSIVKAYPPFDTTQKRQARIFKMAVFDEPGCPK
ncbi:MAG: hypothetical protein LBB60_02805 [Desulfovibrio sp.]|jgi:hypothetical protein|nr:hypothetical protein [Desulfovibrio sp.]